MKTLLTILLASTIWCAATPPPLPVVTTTTKMLVWGPSPTAGITKYRLYHSTNDLTYHTNYLVTGTNYTVTVQAGTTNWFTVKALNSDGIESDPSNVFEQPIQPKPAPASGLQAVPITTSIQTRTPDGQWATLKTYTNNFIVNPEPGREFRSLLDIGRPVELVTLR